MHCIDLVISFCLTASTSSESREGLEEVILFVVTALELVSENLAAIPDAAMVLSNGTVSQLIQNASQQ